MIKNQLLFALRRLTRHKLTTSINILGLAMGITVCLIIFLLAKYELGYDRFHPDGDRIYRFVGASLDPKNGRGDMGFVPVPLPDDARREITGFETVAAFDNWYADVVVPRPGKQNLVFYAAKQGEPSDIIIAQPEYFSIFRYRWLAGNPATALKEPFRVVLSEKEAIRYFGHGDPDQWLGRPLVYQDSLQVTVSGIVQDWKENSDFAFRDFISYATIERSFLKSDYPKYWPMWSGGVGGVVKLAQGVSPAQVERQFPAFLARHMPGGHSNERVALQPLADIHFNERYRDNFSRKVNLASLYGLAGIALFILVIAAINFINLSTAQSIRRAREIGVRKVLGSKRSAIIQQFLSETLLMVLVAATLSLLIANPLLIALQSLLPRGVHLQVFGWPTGLFLLLIVAVTCLLAGFYPARVLSAYQPALSLKGQGIQQLNSKSFLRRSLIVFQFTVSLTFIIGTLIIGRQIRYVLNTDLGFDKDAIITLRTGRDTLYGKRTVLAQKIREIPGVQMVARHMKQPMSFAHSGTFIEYHGATDVKIPSSFDFCDTGYVPLFGLHIIAGRNLFPADTIREFLVNETCARQLGFLHPADALGKMVVCGLNDATGPVVGIIKDFHSQSMHQSIAPFFLTSYEPWEASISVKLATGGQSVGHLKETLANLEKAWAEVYPYAKFEYVFFDETIARLYDTEEKEAEIMKIAMGVAIFISCMGLFGLAAFVAEQRTKEIGIRKVMGATVTDIVTMLSKDFVRLVVLAILIASPIAWYFMHRWLQDFAYRIPISWWIYAIAGACAIGVALLTVSYQAFRAATTNPVESLRTE
jgi:putative ABC transport system permease protein